MSKQNLYENNHISDFEYFVNRFFENMKFLEKFEQNENYRKKNFIYPRVILNTKPDIYKLFKQISFANLREAESIEKLGLNEFKQNFDLSFNGIGCLEISYFYDRIFNIYYFLINKEKITVKYDDMYDIRFGNLFISFNILSKQIYVTDKKFKPFGFFKFINKKSGEFTINESDFSFSYSKSFYNNEEIFKEEDNFNDTIGDKENEHNKLKKFIFIYEVNAPKSQEINADNNKNFSVEGKNLKCSENFSKNKINENAKTEINNKTNSSDDKMNFYYFLYENSISNDNLLKNDNKNKNNFWFHDPNALYNIYINLKSEYETDLIKINKVANSIINLDSFDNMIDLKKTTFKKIHLKKNDIIIGETKGYYNFYLAIQQIESRLIFLRKFMKKTDNIYCFLNFLIQDDYEMSENKSSTIKRIENEFDCKIIILLFDKKKYNNYLRNENERKIQDEIEKKREFKIQSSQLNKYKEKPKNNSKKEGSFINSDVSQYEEFRLKNRKASSSNKNSRIEIDYNFPSHLANLPNNKIQAFNGNSSDLRFNDFVNNSINLSLKESSPCSNPSNTNTNGSNENCDFFNFKNSNLKRKKKKNTIDKDKSN